MSKLIKKFFLFIFILTISSVSGFSQSIDVSGGLGEYDLSEYPGYAKDGIFYASLTKTTGIIPAGTLGFSISLAPEVTYTGGDFYLPHGWVLESSSPTSLYIINTNVDWTDNEILFLIPIRAIKGRTSKSQARLVTYDNIGGNWVDPVPDNNWTMSSVTVIDNPLPVTLVSFSAGKEGNTALLKWTTTSETNSDRFEIERSANGKNWIKVGTVLSHGESSTSKNYSFPDDEPIPGENLYRLRMVDKDATFAYSRIQSVKFEGIERELSIYPNPTSDYVSVRDFNKVKNISVIDTFGKEVSNINNATPLPVSTGQIDVKGLSTGIYLVKITRLDGTLSTHKLLINR